MNNNPIYRNLSLALICGAFAPAIHAQTATKDTAFNRQISVERDFNPTLQDANKINTLPSLYEPVVKKSNASLADWSPSGTPKMVQLTNLGAGNFGTAIEHDLKRGYAGFALGTHGNIQGEAGIQAISSEKTELDFLGTYNASSAKPKKIGYLVDNDVKAKFSEALLKARFQHQFNPFTLFVNTSYQNIGFNYYGSMYDLNQYLYYNPYGSMNTSTKQSAGIFDVNAGVKSKYQTILRYEARVTYNSLAMKYGLSKIYKGPIAHIIQADANFNTDFGSDRVIGINFHLLDQSFSRNKDGYYGGFDDLSHFKFNPYINIVGSNWKTTIGVNAHITFDEENKILFAPNLSASWNFVPSSTLYASAVGDIKENTYRDIVEENRYALPLYRIAPSRTYYDVTVGAKTGSLKGFEFEVFAGHKYTSMEHLYLIDPIASWGNVNSVIYVDMHQSKLGAVIKTNLIPYVDLSGKLTTYFYDVKYRNDYTYPEFAWNKPTYTVELNADIKPFDKFVVSANYLLAGGRKYFNTYTLAKESMKNINELNLKGNYQLTKSISTSLTLNNAFNQAYELSPGYANYGLNLLVGINIKF
jgi:hypothetical protein